MQKSLFDIVNDNSEKLEKLQEMNRDGSILKSNLICAKCEQLFDRSYALIHSSGNIQVGKPITAK